MDKREAIEKVHKSIAYDEKMSTLQFKFQVLLTSSEMVVGLDKLNLGFKYFS